MRTTIRVVTLLLAGLVLVACGGGGGPSPYTSGSGSGGSGGSGGGGASNSASVAVSLSTNVVTAATPATVTATVRDASGNVVPNGVVSFSTRFGFGTLNPTTALTNASGQAVTSLSPASNSSVGADEVTASTTVNGATVTATQGYQLTASNVTVSAFTSDLAGAALSAYGQTSLTVTLAGAPTGTSVTVGVTSACVTAGKASLTPASAATTTGTATFTYKDLGCGVNSTSDSLQATVTGTAATRALSLTLTSPTVSSIAFVSATPETVYLKGSGFTETSTVTFRVVDVSGNPLPGQVVSMSATTYTGGLTLDGVPTAVAKTSDTNGRVTVLVNSGTVPTPVRVRATLVNAAITTSSSNLSIAVGLPTQNAFSISQKTLNIEGFDIDGTTNTYTIIASDRMSNPVPAGTAINFVSEGGQIVGSSQISLANGIASTTVNFVSASPRPADGRVTVVAYALGEESFVDANGNNIYDAGEAFQDLGDIFISRSFDFTAGYDAVNDQRIPQTLTGSAATCVNASTANSASALLALNVTIPSVATFGGANRCDGVWGQAFVRRATETVLSTSASDPVWFPGAVPGTPLSSIPLRNTPDVNAAPINYPRVSNTLVSGGGLKNSLSFLLRDANPVRLNPMAAGTAITVEATTGLTVKVTGGSPVASTTSASQVNLSYEFAAGTASGTITLHIRSPSGLVTDVDFQITP